MQKPAAFHSPKHKTYDVVIIGGAIMGSSLAWFLADNPDFDGSILVVEKDPTYAFSSTAHTNSCMRQQFSQEINIRISQFAARYVRNFRHFMRNDPRVPELTIHEFGYLYLAHNEEFAAILRESSKLQQACGAGTRHSTTEQIARDYPFFNLDGIIAGNHNPVDEGYFDGNTLFDWWRRSAREKGVEYCTNEVIAMSLDASANRVQDVTLSSGEKIACGIVVNASGPRAALTSRMAGIDVPVEPRKRYTYVFAAEKPLDRDLPLTIDPSGVHMRTDGTYYMAGCPPSISGAGDPAVEPDDFDEDHSLWQEHVWPAIAHRIPQFEAIRLVNSWVGHYAYNTLDQNAVLGPHTKVCNFYFLNGFSGHGLQQAPAMGRGTAELIAYGSYRTLDLSPFHYDRIENNRHFVEKAVI